MSCFAFQKRHQRFSCAVRKGIKDQLFFSFFKARRSLVRTRGRTWNPWEKGGCSCFTSKDRRSLMLRHSFPFGSSLITSCEVCACQGLLWRLYVGHCLVASCLVFSFLFSFSIILVVGTLSLSPGTSGTAHVVVNDNRCRLWLEQQYNAQANTLLRKFSMCSVAVKTTLFRSYCTPMYTAHLWHRYRKCSMRKLTVAYNDCMRLLLKVPRCSSASHMFVSVGVPTCSAVLRNLITMIGDWLMFADMYVLSVLYFYFLFFIFYGPLSCL